MKVTYDSVSRNYAYPLSRTDLEFILSRVPPDVCAAISGVRFGCNQTTTQEGRIVRRGNQYEIRVNFCLCDGASRLLGNVDRFRKFVLQLGGIIDQKAKKVIWNPDSAKRYAAFLVLHEVGHIIYSQKNGDRQSTTHGSSDEEKWCDKFALDLAIKL